MANMVICDDDKNIAVLVEEQICEIFTNHRIDMKTEIFTNSEEAFSYCSNYKTDFVLLDIDMPKLNGFEFAKKLQKLPVNKLPIVIFMSSQEQFVYEAFQYKPFDFLRKSCIGQELESKIGRLIREYLYNNEQVELVRDEIGCVLLKEVYYFSSERNRVIAHTKEQDYRCKDTISDMEEKYVNCLIKTNRQHLVNVNYIKRLLLNDVLLTNGMKIPVSRRQKKIVEERYERLKRK